MSNQTVDVLKIIRSKMLTKASKSSTINTSISLGRSNKVKTAKGTRIDTVFAVVDIEQVIASHTGSGAKNPKYPQELQPRDRSRDSSQAWVQKTSNDLDPDSLGRTGRADTGAPIVGDDLVVESGNGRTMAIKLAYENGKAEEYKEWLLDEAEYFGFSRNQVDAINKPILIRIRQTEIDRVQFAIEANQDDKLSYTATERAKSDAKRIDEDMLMLFDPSDNGDLMAVSNHKFLSAFLAKLGDAETAQYSDKDGRFTQSFVMRVKQAIFAKAYNDDRLLEMMADHSKPEMQNMINALTASSPKFIEAQAFSRANTEDVASKITDSIEQSLDNQVVDAIIDASNAILASKRSNQNITEYVKQQGLFGDLPDGVAELAVFISENNNSAKKLTLFFSAMAEYVEKTEKDKQNFGLFGEPEPVHVKDAVIYALNKFNESYSKGTTNMFDDAVSGFVTKPIDMLKYIRTRMMLKLIEQAKSESQEITVSSDLSDTAYLQAILDGKLPLNTDTLMQCVDVASDDSIDRDLLDSVAEVFLNKLRTSNIQFEETSKVLNDLDAVNDAIVKLNVAHSLYALEFEAGCLHTTKKGKDIYGFLINGKVKKSVIKKYDEYTFSKDSAHFVRYKNTVNMPDNLLSQHQILANEVLKYVFGKYSDLESIGGLRGRTSVSSDIQSDTGTTQSVVGEPSSKAGERGNERNGSAGVSESHDERVDGEGDREHESTQGRDNPATDVGNGSNGSNGNGSLAKRERDRATLQKTKSARKQLSEKEQAQFDANDEPTAWGEKESIDKALPYLLPEQRDDVFKAEQHLIDGNNNGILFTNGTGTGKTFTGLGSVKRFVNAGLKKILIVTLNDKIVRDFVKSGKPLGLDIHQLKSSSENGGDGNSIIATTYANFAQNSSLILKDWDLIVVDESHALMQNADGTVTSALRKLRALSGHHSGFDDWFSVRFASQFPERNEDGEFDDPDTEENWANLKREEEEKWKKRWATQPKGRTKVVFLSATPFSYDKSVDWAEGYLFHYVEPSNTLDEDGSSKGYNTGGAREKFFMQNFGYRMRYNKLTKPNSDVNNGVMERMLAEKLKNTGAISGRELVIDFDYDRKFVMIESKVGELIDEGLRYLSPSQNQVGENFNQLYRFVNKRFDYLSRRRLLEAIKANEIVGYVKKHLAMNRKVVIFHDYNEGGGFKPFFFDGEMAFWNEKNGRVDRTAEGEYERFEKERPDLVGLSLDYDSPLVTLKRAFPSALFFNGRISKGKRQENVDLFNADNSGHDILIVQSDAGSTGISLHDVTGTHQRVSINIGQPIKPAKLRQTEGRIYRVGQSSNAIQRYITTGTDWERGAFADTIAGRAETVDNLSKGNDAMVSIREEIIRAYEEAEYADPSEDDGVGGKAYAEENQRIARLSPFDQALTHFYAKGKNAKKRNQREGMDWYATPEPLGMKMMQWAGAHTGDKILEPSAGDGAIGRYAPDDASITMIEPSSELASRARMANPSANIIEDSFESLDNSNKYHAIVMNPPFGNAGATAIEHLRQAFYHLYDGGRMVALIPIGAMDKKVDDWLLYQQQAHLVAEIKLPKSTFSNAGTSVMTRIIVIDRYEESQEKPISQAQIIDLSNSSADVKMEHLFDEIRDLHIEPRRLRIDEKLDMYGLYVLAERSKYIFNGKGLKNEIIKRIILDSSFSARINEFGEIEMKYNRSAKILKNIVEYERSSGESLLAVGFDSANITMQFDALDHGELNVPLAKRGNIDAQLDQYKKEQGKLNKDQADLKKMNHADAQKVAKPAFEALTNDDFRYYAKRTGIKLSEAKSELKSMAHWQPQKAIKIFKALKDYAEENSSSENTAMDAVNPFNNGLQVLQLIREKLHQKHQGLSDVTTSENYRWKDVGYVAGSKKEIAETMRKLRAEGRNITINDLDWDSLSADSRQAQSLITKDNVFGTVDWQALKAENMPPEVGYFISRVYRAVEKQPISPKHTESQKAYVQAITNLRDNLEKCRSYEDVKDYIVDLSKQLIHPSYMTAYYSVDGNLEQLRSLSSRHNQIAKYLESLDSRVMSELGKRFYSWIFKSANKALHEMKTGKNPNKNFSPSVGKTWDWAESGSNAGDNIENSKPRKKSFQLEHADHLERIGGRKVNIASSQELKDMFGLNAVQSGNYVLKDKSSAEFHMQASAEAMLDMSDVLGIDAKHLGLNGNLALAFGARGKGGALAHYEPSSKIINITKLKGGGSLGHEYFHALDNLINDLDTGVVGDVSFMASNDSKKMPNSDLGKAFADLVNAMSTRNGFAYQSEIEFNSMSDTLKERKTQYGIEESIKMGIDVENDSLDELSKKIVATLNKSLEKMARQNPHYPRKGLAEFAVSKHRGNMQYILYARHVLKGDVEVSQDDKILYLPLDSFEYETPSSFKYNANVLDEGRKSYWSSNHEMSARAFTSYLADKLAEQGRKNDYLAYEGYHSQKAFPQGDERKAINQAFDRLFAVIRDKNIFKNASENQALMDSLFGT